MLLNLFANQTMFHSITKRIIQNPTTRISLTKCPNRFLATDSLNVVGGDGANRVVILGTGWAGFNLALNMKSDQAPSIHSTPEIRIVSPSNHFVFTPLLPSTAVGTLEFRAIQEPIRKVLGKNGNFVQAKAMSLNTKEKSLICESTHDQKKFKIKYEKLVIAVGVKTNTFGIKR